MIGTIIKSELPRRRNNTERVKSPRKLNKANSRNLSLENNQRKTETNIDNTDSRATNPASRFKLDVETNKIILIDTKKQ